jgi:hypothetical protein
MSEEGLRRSSIAKGNKDCINHTDIVLSNHFFSLLTIVRAAEMAVQNKRWDHVCKTQGQEVRALVLTGSCR